MYHIFEQIYLRGFQKLWANFRWVFQAMSRSPSAISPLETASDLVYAPPKFTQPCLPSEFSLFSLLGQWNALATTVS